MIAEETLTKVNQKYIVICTEKKSEFSSLLVLQYYY